jgi:CRP-like cAMP-binding protein
VPNAARRETAYCRLLFAHDLIGLAQNGSYVNSAEAVTTATLYRIPAAPLQARLRNYPDLDVQVISKLCHELREAQRQYKHRCSYAALRLRIEAFAGESLYRLFPFGYGAIGHRDSPKAKRA